MFRSIKAKFVAPLLLLALPFALLLHFLVSTHERGLATARNELSGLPSINAALSLANALIAWGGVGDSTRVSEQAARTGAVFKEELALWAHVPLTQERLREGLRAAEQLKDNPELMAPSIIKLIESLTNLVQSVGDSSELILDPELDSYYLMDLLVIQHPALLTAIWQLRTEATALEADGTDALASRMRLSGYRYGLNAALDSARRSQTTLLRHARDPLIKAALNPIYSDLFDTIASIQETSRPLTDAALQPTYRYMLETAMAARIAASQQLQRVLELRIAGIERLRDQQIMASIAICLTVLAILLWLINHLLTQPLTELTEAMLKLSTGDTGIGLNAVGRNDEVGAMSRAVLVFKDNAIRKTMLEQQARADAEAMAATGEALAEAQSLGRIGNFVYRLGEETVMWSPEVFRLMRLDPERFRPTRESILARCRGNSARNLLQNDAELMRGGGVRAVDVTVERGDGTLADFMLVQKADVDEQGRMIGFLGTIQDISERKTAERELEKLAYYDPLSGLANRALFQRIIRAAIAESRAAAHHGALLMLDLDRFKEVNDSLGHQAGDELLVNVGERLRRVLPHDAFLARLGGDEFAAILKHTGRDEALAKAVELIAILSEPYELSLGQVSIGTSVGIAMLPEDGASADELMSHADIALYRAKEGGRGRVELFRPEFSAFAQQKIRLARDLAGAIQQNQGLYLVYQPQVHLATGAVTGFEALVRWQHPDLGNIPPSEFVPIAESSKLICDLGLWVLRAACRQIRLWRDEGHPLREVAVNVSAAQFWHSDMERDIADALLNEGIAPDLLCIELTESVFARDGDARLRKALEAIQALGVRLALDDFGTGYSSLAYLNRLPFDKLKIDRSFVDGVDLNSEKMKVLRGIVSMSQALGKRTIAEGAERQEEVDVLVHLGCECVQGYVFARPMLPGQVIERAVQIEAESLLQVGQAA
ncbi:MAG: EAL domain-containing protein [Hyphomicrobiales bacterium]|nr:EAL domain-containing protein [Hyphomicrobiales bacterium]